jgi:hypothetical protein
VFGLAPVKGGPVPVAERRRRRLFVAAISVAAALVVIALFAGTYSMVAAINGMRHRAGDARAASRLRADDCADLERRLNRLVPPGATTARATAIQNENLAVRLYVNELDSQRDEDAWRQLIDSRTLYADALSRQAQTRTPAFYVAPRTLSGLDVADELGQWSPAECAGPIHRLAQPEL